MKKTITGLLLLAAFTSAPSYALFGLGDDDADALKNAASSMGVSSDSMDQLTSAVTSGQQGMELVSTLTDELGVTKEQATGGAAALLAMAQENLSAENLSKLSETVPGLESLLGNSEMLSSITNLESVQAAFTKLGLESSMVEQFAPVVQSFLEEQGASEGLLSALSQAWGTAA